MIREFLLFGVQICALHSLPLNPADENLKNDPLTTDQQPPSLFPSAPKISDELVTAVLHPAEDAAINRTENSKLREIAKSYAPDSSNSSKSDRQRSNESAEMIRGKSILIPFNPSSDHTFMGGPPPARPPRPPITVTIPPDVEIISTGRPIPQTVPPHFTLYPPVEFIPPVNTGPLISYENKQSAAEMKNKNEPHNSQLYEKSSTSNQSTVGIVHAGSNYSVALRVSHDTSGKSQLCIYEVIDHYLDESKNRTCIHFRKPGEKVVTKNDSRIESTQNVVNNYENLNATTTAGGTSSKPIFRDNGAKTEKLVWEVKNATFEKLSREKSISDEVPKTESASVVSAQNSTPSTKSETLDRDIKKTELTKLGAERSTSDEALEGKSSGAVLAHTATSAATEYTRHMVSQVVRHEQNTFPNDVAETNIERKKTDNQNGRVAAENSVFHRADHVRIEEKMGKARSNDENEDESEGGRSVDTGRTIIDRPTIPSTSTTQRPSDRSHLEKKSAFEEKTRPTEIDPNSKYWRSMVLEFVKNLSREINRPKSDYVYEDLREEDNAQPNLEAREVFVSPYEYEVGSMDTIFDGKMASNNEDYADTYLVPILYTA